jgi:hypothetical protein
LRIDPPPPFLHTLTIRILIDGKYAGGILAAVWNLLLCVWLEAQFGDFLELCHA